MTLSGMGKSLDDILNPVSRSIVTLGLSVVLLLFFIAKDFIREFGLLETPGTKEHSILIENQSRMIMILNAQQETLKNNVKVNFATCLNLAKEDKEERNRCLQAFPGGKEHP